MTTQTPSGDTLNQQLEALRREGQFSQAAQVAKQVIQQLRQAGQSGPPMVAALTTLAEVLAAGGHTDDARRLLLQAGQMLAPGEALPPAEAGRIAYNLGLLFLEQANYAQAEAQLTTALNQRQTALGRAAPALAPILNGLGQVQVAQGNDETAQDYFEQALVLSPPEQTLNRANSLTGLAQVQQGRGAYLQAKAQFEEALALRQASLGEQHPAIAQALLKLAGVETELGDYTNAEAHYQTALDLNHRSLGEQHPATAATLEQVAGLYQLKGEFDLAESSFKQALAVQRARVGEQHPDFVRGLANLAGLYQQKGDTTQARQQLLLALQTAQSAKPPRPPLVARIKNALGQLYRTLGRYELARQELDQALALQQQADFGETHAELAATRHHLAELALDRGDYRQAAAEEKAALEIRLKALGPAHPAVADSQQSLAALYHRIGDDGPARDLLAEALATRQAAFGQRHLQVAATLHPLAEVQAALGDSAAAEQGFRHALEIRREKLGADHPAVARSLTRLAELLLAEGQLDQAEKELLAAIKIWQAEVGRRHPDFATGLHQLAQLYQAKGQASEANNFYRWALQISREALGNDHPAVGQVLTGWATLEAAGGQIEPALSKMREATIIDRGLIGQVFSLASERQRLGYLRHLTRRYNLFLSLVSQHLSDQPAAVAAAGDLVLQRKALSAEALAVQRDEILQGRYPALQDDLRRLVALREQIAQQTLAGPGEEAPETYQKRLTDWMTEKEALEAELATKIPEMDLAQKLRRVDRLAVAAALPAAITLVELVRFDRFDFAAVSSPPQAGYLALLLPAGQPEALRLVDLGDAGEIDALIAAFRTTITGEVERRGATVVLQREAVETRLARRRRTDETSGAAPANPGQQLAERLLDPLGLPLDQIDRLLIAPDGDLARLPFEILPLGDGPNERLIHRLPVSYLSVGRDVLRFGQQPTQPPTTPLVIADPDFDLVAPAGAGQASPVAVSIHFGRLAGTHQEGETVGRLLGVEPLLAEAALKRRVKEQPSPRVLHIATHGFFLTPQPGSSPAERDRLSRLADQVENPLLRSGLALAGINSWNKGLPLPEAAENGLLTGEDVSGLDLTATELVVLSACETGLGAVEVGEGVFGLRRAFMLAGAKNLVMSLWEVPDKQTQQLMEDFYANLAQGQVPATALRQAQLKLAEAQPNPFYWGAFICQGEVS